MISWLGDLLHILAASDSLWKALALLLMAIVGHQLWRQLKRVRSELTSTNIALVKNGHPISVKQEFADLDVLLQKTLEQQGVCYVRQAQCMSLQQEFRNEPWRFCMKFQDCPTNVEVTRLIAKVATEATTQLEEIRMMVNGSFERAKEDRQRLEDMILKNREVVTAFTSEFGAEVIRAVTKGMKPITSEMDRDRGRRE